MELKVRESFDDGNPTGAGTGVGATVAVAIVADGPPEILEVTADDDDDDDAAARFRRAATELEANFFASVALVGS